MANIHQYATTITKNKKRNKSNIHQTLLIQPPSADPHLLRLTMPHILEPSWSVFLLYPTLHYSHACLPSLHLSLSPFTLIEASVRSFPYFFSHAMIDCNATLHWHRHHHQHCRWTALMLLPCNVHWRHDYYYCC